jgi:CDP-glycerol glycerophosphotransferase
VVVPAYNVEPYLAECLDSILAQAVALECIVVDDGSVDGTAAIADRYAAGHPQVSLVRASHQGLGAARNAGVDRSSGRYLTFVDADDVVPRAAYRRLIRSLRQTGSDFAVGSMARWSSDGVVEPPWARRIHRTPRPAMQLEEFPDVIADVSACNKVFRSDFWAHAGLRFPEGQVFEDQVTLTEAYLRAHRIDVLAQTTYRWRIREDGTSITRGNATMRNVADRFVAKRRARVVVERQASVRVRRYWLAHILPANIINHLPHVPGCSTEYWSTLRDGVRHLWPDHGAIASLALTPPRRAFLWLVHHDRREETDVMGRLVREARTAHRPRLAESMALQSLLGSFDVDVPPELLA